MAITPGEDKDAFWKRIRNDPWMEKSFGLAGKSDSDAALKIRKNRTVDDIELKDGIRLALIYDTPSNETGHGNLFELSCIEVDILAPSTAQDWADKKLTQVIALCGLEWNVNGRPIYKVVRAGELTSSPGYYRCGARFYYYSSTVTQIQTI